MHNKKNIPKYVENTDVIVYGHSHKYEEKYSGGQLFLNPGSCGPGRFRLPVTFAVIEITEDHSFQVKRIEIAHRARESGADVTRAGESGDAGSEMAGRDMKKVVKAVMRDTDRKISVQEMAVKNGISEELAEQVCRLYLTHPGVSAEGILRKMGL